MDSRIAVAILLSISAFGCTPGSRPARKSSAPEPEPKTEKVRSIAAKKLTLTALDEKQEKSWTISAANATVDLYSNENLSTELRNVSGTLFEKNSAKATYKASKAKANQKTRQLNLWDGVQLTGLSNGSQLKADSAKWWPTAELIEAKGNILVKSDQYEAGPFTQLFATRELDWFGTPDALKNDPKMKNRIVGMTLAIAAMAQAVTFKDKDGNMVLRELTSWSTLKKGESEFEFKGRGNPFIGTWRDQGLELSAQTIDGTAKKGKAGFYLSNATVRGNLTAQIKQTEAGSTRVTKLRSTQLVFKGSEDKFGIDLTGTVRVESDLGNGKQLLTLLADQGNFQFAADGAKGNSLSSANLSGGITVTLKEKRSNGLLNLKGTANRCVYQAGSPSTLTLLGNVVLTGEDDSIGGEMTAAKLVATLNDKGEVISLDAEGEPGTSSLREKP